LETTRAEKVAVADPADSVLPTTYRLSRTLAIPLTSSGYVGGVTPIPSHPPHNVIPPIVLDDVGEFDTPLFESTTPPIVLDVVGPFEIAPVEESTILAVLRTELDSVHPPIELDVEGPFEMFPPLSWTLAIVYTLHPKSPDMFPPTFRLLVIVAEEMVVIPVAIAYVNPAAPPGFPLLL
jgi:hypothetical protein